MKKKLITAVMAVLLIISLLVGCASGNSSDAATGGSAMYNNAPQAMESVSADVAFDSKEYDGQMDVIYSTSAEAEDDIAGVIASASRTYNLKTEKIIYTAYAHMETLEFDVTVQAVYDMMEEYGAYIENSYVSGTDYATRNRGGRSYRTAEFGIRVPVENYSAMSVGLTDIGNVTLRSRLGFIVFDIVIVFCLIIMTAVI